MDQIPLEVKVAEQNILAIEVDYDEVILSLVEALASTTTTKAIGTKVADLLLV